MYRIVESHIAPKTEVVEMNFPMISLSAQRKALEIQWEENANAIEAILQRGKNVVFLTLGDPMVFSTYSYVMEFLLKREVEVVTLSGIPSFCNLAAQLNLPLTQGEESLGIVAATQPMEEIRAILDAHKNIIIMKISACNAAIAQELEERGLQNQFVLVSNIGMETQSVLRDVEVLKGKIPYLSTLLSVVKDAGDDPDVTHGVKVYATVTKKESPGITFCGGLGVGTVTRAGLSIAVGEPAINPVPREMMTREIMKVMKDKDYAGGFEVKIAIPQGVELARRTFNPKLGIVGGLSVVGTSGIVEPMSEEALKESMRLELVGTSGIVEPMSEEALKESMRLELAMLKAQNTLKIIFVPGNYGRDYALAQGLPDALMVKTSNYMGYMLEEAEHMGFEEILLVGHLGQLVKVAGGLFNTHSAVCDGRMEILAAHAALLGAPQELVAKIMESVTTDEATNYLLAQGLDGYFDHLAQAVKKRCEAKVYGNIHIEAILFSKEHGFLGASSGALEMEKKRCTH